MVTDLKRVSEALEGAVYGPDGKLDVMARDVRPPAREVLEELALRMGEMTAQEVAEEQTKATRAMVRQAMRGMAGEEYARNFMRQAPAWGNRKTRRAAAAQARRRP